MNQQKEKNSKLNIEYILKLAITFHLSKTIKEGASIEAPFFVPNYKSDTF